MQKDTAFSRYIGIDYSGAETPTSGLKGLRAYQALHDTPPMEIGPPVGHSSKYWSRRGLAEWLVRQIGEGLPAIIGIDHGFSFPMRYFEFHRLPPDWDLFLADFRHHWPTHEEHTYVDFVRDGLHGDGSARMGQSRWRRTCEICCRAKSVFHFDVPGSVAKATHAGLPWLLYLRRQLGKQLHFWPFDGWHVPAGCSVIAETYPALWKQLWPREDRTPDQHDAYTIAAWLQQADQENRLKAAFQPALPAGLFAEAQVEGWILGVDWQPPR